jgi:hypothetical protein
MILRLGSFQLLAPFTESEGVVLYKTERKSRASGSRALGKYH